MMAKNSFILRKDVLPVYCPVMKKKAQLKIMIVVVSIQCHTDHRMTFSIKKQTLKTCI